MVNISRRNNSEKAARVYLVRKLISLALLHKFRERIIGYYTSINLLSYFSCQHIHLAHDSTGIRWTHHHERVECVYVSKEAVKLCAEKLLLPFAMSNVEPLRFSFPLKNNNLVASHARASIVLLLLIFASYIKMHYFAVMFSACEANAAKHRYKQKPIAFLSNIYYFYYRIDGSAITLWLSGSTTASLRPSLFFFSFSVRWARQTGIEYRMNRCALSHWMPMNVLHCVSRSRAIHMRNIRRQRACQRNAERAKELAAIKIRIGKNLIEAEQIGWSFVLRSHNLMNVCVCVCAVKNEANEIRKLDCVRCALFM